MGRLILQMHISVDGFVARPNGDVDWVVQERDDGLLRAVNAIHESVGRIIMGRKMAQGFVAGWKSGLANTAKSDALARRLALKMVETPKVVFSRTLEQVPWERTTLAKGDAFQEVQRLKSQAKSDIIVFGGAHFVSYLIERGLIDEYIFLVNPVALGEGLAVFRRLKGPVDLQLVTAQSFDCGVVLHRYKPKR